MPTDIMPVFLSQQPASLLWGKNALISINDIGVTIHLSSCCRIRTIQRAGRKLDVQGINNVKLTGDGWDLEASWAFWQGYRSAKRTTPIEWPKLNKKDTKELIDRLNIIDWVKDTTNMPAQELGPEQLAQRAIELMTRAFPDVVNYRMIKGNELEDAGYHGLHTVGRGSVREPVLLILDYNPTKKPDEPVLACLVGKGISFDSGGYSIKPSNFMDSMKSDMGGAALATGALALAAARGLKQRVKLYLCCADNLISGNAFKLGDIIRYRNEKTVEIMNTDAEGRLVLADGLLEADEQNAQFIIDCATLTGAAKTAVGSDYHALLGFDDDLVQALLLSAKEENELFWRLPLAEFHRSQLPSNFAELNNIAAPSHSAGASTAAAFLSHFVKKPTEGWLHIDCSAAYHKTAVELWAAGATGIGVRSLANLLLTKSC